MSEKESIFVTKEGLEKLKMELKDLVEIKRPELAKRIQAAREMGDISENSEYDSSLQARSFVEGCIQELEEIIKTAKISDEGVAGVVGMGCRVTVHVDGDKQIFHIVGAPEANPMEGKISHESPLGSALIGKKTGDKIEVEAPMGKLSYTIVKVEY